MSNNRWLAHSGSVCLMVSEALVTLNINHVPWVSCVAYSASRPLYLARRQFPRCIERARCDPCRQVVKAARNDPYDSRVSCWEDDTLQLCAQ